MLQIFKEDLLSSIFSNPDYRARGSLNVTDFRANFAIDYLWAEPEHSSSRWTTHVD